MSDLGKQLKRLARPFVPLAMIMAYHRKKRLEYIDSLTAAMIPGRRTILAINHHCDQDYAAIALVNSRFNFVEVVAGTLFMGSSNYFTDEVEFIRAPYDSEPAEHRARYRAESRLIYERLRKRCPFDLILIPNDNYFFVREFIDIAHQDGIKTVVLDKEGIISPHSYLAESKRARENTPCIADHIFVWSHRQKSFWGEKGVPSDRITVVGQPRSDLLFQDPGCRLDGYFEVRQPVVTAFSFLDTAYMPTDYVNKTGGSWRSMKADLHESVVGLAEKYAGCNFVIKCHPQQRDLGAIRRKYNRRNVRVIGGAELGNELILRSELVIAFQTTAMIEAMLVGRKAIYMAWDPQIKTLEEYLLPFHQAAGIVIADSLRRMQEVAERVLNGDVSDFTFSEEERGRRREFVDGYLYSADGHASERFLEAVERFLS
jgi:hypothetical protein